MIYNPDNPREHEELSFAITKPGPEPKRRVIFRGDRKPILISKAVADGIRESKNTWITIQDEHGDILFEGSRQEIKEIEHPHVHQAREVYGSTRWICDFGHRHTWNETCDCSKTRYENCPPGHFISAMHAAFPGTIIYAQDLDEKKRLEIVGVALQEWESEKENKKVDSVGNLNRMKSHPVQTMAIP